MMYEGVRALLNGRLTMLRGFSKQATDEKPRPLNEATYLVVTKLWVTRHFLHS
jgi:hypothetical protein